MDWLSFDLDLTQNSIIIDVRSESEYIQGHIPGAFNVPVLNDEHRKIVGTIYKQAGKEKAILKGLELLGPDISTRLKLAIQYCQKEQNIIIHCWRGGMRSQFFAFIMEFYGFKVKVLQGGYKAFRNHVLNSFKLPYQINVLGGKTGSGKTHVLNELKSKGAAMIDLEGLAHHRGSSFGAIGMPLQPSQEQFENELSLQLFLLNQNTIWIEDEGRTVGSRVIPEGLWLQMRKAPHYFLDTNFEMRLNQIMIDYGSFPKEELLVAMERIAKRLGPQHVKTALEAINNGQIKEAFAMALAYYDKAYTFQKEKHPLGEKIEVEVEQLDASEIAAKLMKQ